MFGGLGVCTMMNNIQCHRLKLQGVVVEHRGGKKGKENSCNLELVKKRIGMEAGKARLSAPSISISDSMHHLKQSSWLSLPFTSSQRQKRAAKTLTRPDFNSRMYMEKKRLWLNFTKDIVSQENAQLLLMQSYQSLYKDYICFKLIVGMFEMATTRILLYMQLVYRFSKQKKKTNAQTEDFNQFICSHSHSHTTTQKFTHHKNEHG